MLQEVKLPNRQLLDFLVRDSTLEELFHYIVDIPNDSLAGEAMYKLPYAACEVLCCEVWLAGIHSEVHKFQCHRVEASPEQMWLLCCYEL